MTQPRSSARKSDLNVAFESSIIQRCIDQGSTPLQNQNFGQTLMGDCIDEQGTTPFEPLARKSDLSLLHRSTLESSIIERCIDQGSLPFEKQWESVEDLLEETVNSEGTCTVVLHPGDVLEYDPAEYFISEKEFQVKYDCTIDRKQRLDAKSKTLLNLAKVKHVISHPRMISGKTKEGMDQEQLPTLLRSQGVIAAKVKRTKTIDWQDFQAAYTYGYLEEQMPGLQLTQTLRNSYGHLDDEMAKAVFIQYSAQGWPEAWLCLLVEDDAERDTFVKSLNAHVEGAKKRKVEQAELEKTEADKKKLAKARTVTFSPSTQSVSPSTPSVSSLVSRLSRGSK